MDKDIFTKIGLTNNETKVYLTLLGMGAVPAGEIVKKTELHRACVYDVLERLLEKGLTSYVMISNVKHFEATNPRQFLSYIDSKKDELMNYRKQIDKIMPELESKRKLSREEQEATIYKGKRGIKPIFEDIIRQRKTMHVYGATGRFKEFFPVYYHNFHNRRTKAKINIKMIYKESVRKEKREKELKLFEAKYLPNEFDTPATTFIYGEKVVILIWEEQPIATVIRSKKVAQSYLVNFNLLWKIAKK